MKKFKPKNLLQLFIVLNLIIGIFIVSDYGINPDERLVVARSMMALKSYNLNIMDNPPQFHTLRYGQFRGTALSMMFLWWLFGILRGEAIYGSTLTRKSGDSLQDQDRGVGTKL